MSYDLVVVGVSWGGLRALSRLLDALPAEVDLPFVVAQHRAVEADAEQLAGLLQPHTHLRIGEPGDKDPIERGHLYLAPPDYHLLVERGSFALSVDAPVQYARPSVDVLFESVADAYGPRSIGIVLTGANADGAEGLAAIKRAGGIAVVQDPRTAEARQMPDAALRATPADAILPLEEIGPFLFGLACSPAGVLVASEERP